MEGTEVTEIIRLDNVVKKFPIGGGFFSRPKEIVAVSDVSLSLRQKEVIALVGESGCGKTTTGRIAAGLIRPDSGSVIFKGKDIWDRDDSSFVEFRRSVQIVHQDPYASLNPVKTIYDALSSPLLKHGIVHSKKEAIEAVSSLLETVGLTPVEDFIDKYPHQLSGGQRQRVAFARSLTLKPIVLVADEPVSMIDVSVRLGILNLMLDLQRQGDVSYLFITHDLSVAYYFSYDGRMAIMYVGKIVEFGETRKVISEPLHPYTKALLSAIPVPDPDLTRSKVPVELRSLDVPSLLNLPKGCKFHPRCPYFVEGLCDEQEPELREIGTNRKVACHLS